MNYLNPIYTEKRECQDCYKCVRNCPVKAIKVEAGYATVMPELCILCGHCVEICPNGAKKVRDDLPRARQLLASGRRCIVSLAPSFISEFAQTTPRQMVAALKRLGFWGVSETALGAQQVSASVSRLLQEGEPRLLFSAACPTVVAYLQKHRPAYSQYLTGLLSPLLAHCKILRSVYGSDIGIVFIGPCIAKKTDADTRPDLLDVTLTFEDLRRWLEQERIDLAQVPDDAQQSFIPQRAADGAWYPVDGGMIAGIKSNCPIHDCSFMAFSGISAIQKALEGVDAVPLQQSMFLELLACEGGCINGPKVARNVATVAKRAAVLRYGSYPDPATPKPPAVLIDSDFRVAAATPASYSDSQLREALRQVGKFSPDDELNCGGCGYDSCREFAKALIDQKAERSMCVTYMRKLAHKKANALIQKMPSAVVIVNESLQIIECNAAFACLFGKAAQSAGADDAAMPALEGQPLAALVPFHHLFASVMKTGDDIVDKDLRFRETILHLSIFNIEKQVVVGGIIQDVTKPSVQKEQVIRKAQEVIQRNLSTVQKIAYLLGENASESEIILSSIIDSFSPPKIEESGADGDWKKLYKK